VKYETYGRPAGRPNRRSIRLKGYDYAQVGAYFVTICAHNRECLFGEVVDGAMRLNELGKIVRNAWLQSGEIRREIELHADEMVVMPNHIHGIVWIVDDPVGAPGRSPLLQTTLSPLPSNGRSSRPPTGTVPLSSNGPTPRSLASFVAGFKSAATKRINGLRGTPGAPIWQRNYYEHIIHDEQSLTHIREYIANNPLEWTLDRENPSVLAGAKNVSPLQKDEPWRI
jgi:REP element-mobilizing transposase RayT